MKKLICLFFACCVANVVTAQKLTEKDLQGKWVLVTYSTINVSLDVKTGKGSVTQTGKSLGTQFEQRLIEDIESYAENLKIATLEIKGNNFEQILYDIVKSGPYTLEDKENYQILNANFDDGTSALILIGIKDGKLNLGYPKNGKSYVYERAQ